MHRLRNPLSGPAAGLYVNSEFNITPNSCEASLPAFTKIGNSCLGILNTPLPVEFLC